VFPLELYKRLIETYTKNGDVILDPMMGSGSTVVAAYELERKGIGVDVNPDFIELTKKRLSQQKLP
jgi:DNA modification methylase